MTLSPVHAPHPCIDRLLLADRLLRAITEHASVRSQSGESCTNTVIAVQRRLPLRHPHASADQPRTRDGAARRRAAARATCYHSVRSRDRSPPRRYETGD